MRIQYVSDLHLEFHRDGGVEFIKTLPVTGEVLILAGDIDTHSGIEATLRRFSEKWEHVLYVPGNHEYYGSSFPGMKLVFGTIKHKNLHMLHRNQITISGQRFIGATMWFRDHPLNVMFKNGLADFRHVKGFDPAVYDENQSDVEFLANNIREGDVVVTHHLPSYQSVGPLYKGNNTNRFFVCEMEEMIGNAQPKIWIHGHTHDTFDYQLDKTRVVCNPFGYVHATNPRFNPEAVIEL